MKRTILLVVALALTASWSHARDRGPGYSPEGFDELTKQKGIFKTTLIHPDAEFSRYSRLYPKKVVLQLREQRPPEAEQGTGRLVRKRSRGTAIPDYEDLVKLRQILNDAIVNELAHSEAFQLVHEEGPETLVLRASFTDVVTDISTESGRSGGKQKPFSAQGKIFFDLIDAETGVIQARVGERRKRSRKGDSETSTDAEPQWANVCNWAANAAADLRQELERVRNEEKAAQGSNGA